MPRKQRMWIIGFGMVLLLAACDKGQIFHELRPDSVLLAFGDSLTAGGGAEPGASYPAHLEMLIRRKVVNAGLAGETSSAGARRLPGVLDEQKPDLVILGHGGDDLRSGLDRQQVQDNLRHMFEAANQRGIPVVMIAPASPGTAEDAALYTALAEELKIPLVQAPPGDRLPERPEAADPVSPNAAVGRRLAAAVVNKLYELSAI